MTLLAVFLSASPVLNRTLYACLNRSVLLQALAGGGRYLKRRSDAQVRRVSGIPSNREFDPLWESNDKV